MSSAEHSQSPQPEVNPALKNAEKKVLRWERHADNIIKKFDIARVAPELTEWDREYLHTQLTLQLWEYDEYNNPRSIKNRIDEDKRAAVFDANNAAQKKRIELEKLRQEQKMPTTYSPEVLIRAASDLVGVYTLKEHKRYEHRMRKMSPGIFSQIDPDAPQYKNFLITESERIITKLTKGQDLFTFYYGECNGLRLITQWAINTYNMDSLFSPNAQWQRDYFEGYLLYCIARSQKVAAFKTPFYSPDEMLKTAHNSMDFLTEIRQRIASEVHSIIQTTDYEGNESPNRSQRQENVPIKVYMDLQ
ncbi:hypothetical protein HGB07_05845 [Candidatus Roizmanbacteria bacterium]|nr:hypothetical protein [Candidatus Roizmanbacteria bacterium]